MVVVVVVIGSRSTLSLDGCNTGSCKEEMNTFSIKQLRWLIKNINGLTKLFKGTVSRDFYPNLYSQNKLILIKQKKILWSPI